MRRSLSFALFLLVSIAIFFAGCAPGKNEPPIDIPDQRTGSLDGVSVAVSPGHGLRESASTPGTYEYQRAEINGILEDLYTQEFCITYLYPALERCGATVVPLRQRDESIIGATGQAAWTESSLIYLASIGADAASAASISDVTVRPLHAINMDADCLVSIHCNRINGSSRGTAVFVWDDESLTLTPDFSVLPGSSELYARSIRAGIISGAAALDPTWVDEGVRGSYFGELRLLVEDYQAGNTSIPGALIELGYADNTLDAAQLTRPVMMASMARGIVAGIIDSMTSNAALYPPVKPESVSAAIEGDAVRLEWSAGSDPLNASSSAPSSYVVKASLNGGPYANVALVETASCVIEGIVTGHGNLSIVVAARNVHGESLDSEPLAVSF